MPRASSWSMRCSRCAQYAGSNRSSRKPPSLSLMNGKRSGSLLLNVYDFGNTHIRIFVNGAEPRVRRVRSSRSSPWWVHAYAVVPIGRYRVPSAYRKCMPSTRTGPLDVLAVTSNAPASRSRLAALLAVSNRQVPSTGGRNRIR